MVTRRHKTQKQQHKPNKCAKVHTCCYMLQSLSTMRESKNFASDIAMKFENYGPMNTKALHELLHKWHMMTNMDQHAHA
jgi:hypothetical protein